MQQVIDKVRQGIRQVVIPPAQHSRVAHARTRRGEAAAQKSLARFRSQSLRTAQLGHSSSVDLSSQRQHQHTSSEGEGSACRRSCGRAGAPRNTQACAQAPPAPYRLSWSVALLKFYPTMYLIVSSRGYTPSHTSSSSPHTAAAAPTHTNNGRRRRRRRRGRTSRARD